MSTGDEEYARPAKAAAGVKIARQDRLKSCVGLLMGCSHSSLALSR